MREEASSRWQARFWLLALFSGIEKVGRSPLNLPDLNALIYLANATIPCYEVASLDATVRKLSSGPVYPDAIWDLDRLVGMLLLGIAGTATRSKSAVNSPRYFITRMGVDLITRIRASEPEFEKTAGALMDIVAAYARLPNSLAPKSLLARDANYAEVHVTLGDVVDFGEWNTSNFTKNAVIAVKSDLRARLEPLGRDRATPSGLAELIDNPGISLRLYAQYLSAEAKENLNNERE